MRDTQDIKAAVNAAIEAAALYLEAEAMATRSAGGLPVGEADTGFAAQRLRACANGLRAGLHINPDRKGEGE